MCRRLISIGVFYSPESTLKSLSPFNSTSIYLKILKKSLIDLKSRIQIWWISLQKEEKFENSTRHLIYQNFQHSKNTASSKVRILLKYIFMIVPLRMTAFLKKHLKIVMLIGITWDTFKVQVSHRFDLSKLDSSLQPSEKCSQIWS